MADPTPTQLAEFFAAATQLRSVYARVDIVFRGANTLPDIVVYWSSVGPPATTLKAEAQSADDIIAAMQQLYTDKAHVGELRAQRTTLQQQIYDIERELEQIGVR